MKLEVDKTYLTRGGKKVRIIATDMRDKQYPVVGLINYPDKEVVQGWTKSGRYYDTPGRQSSDDVVSEYSFWNEVKVDTKVLVRNSKEDEWVKRHFAKYEDSKVLYYPFGMTSYTSTHNNLPYSQYTKLYDEQEVL